MHPHPSTMPVLRSASPKLTTPGNIEGKHSRHTAQDLSQLTNVKEKEQY